MKRTHRLITMLLLFALLLSGCGTGTAETGAAETSEPTAAEQETPETETEAAAYRDSVPEMTFDGKEFVFLTREFDGNGYWGNMEFDAEEMNAEAINDAVFNRNSRIEERFDITISEIRTEPADQSARLANSVASADDAYDCVSIRMDMAANNALSGNLLDFSELQYIDLSNPWWDSEMNAHHTLAKKQYYATGDMTLIDKEATYLVMFNKDVASEHSVEDLYALVENGSWTVDKMLEICETLTNDLNGDGNYTIDDRYGMVSDNGALQLAMYYSLGGTFTQKNADDIPELSIDMDRAVRAIEKSQELNHSPYVMKAETLQQQGVANPWSDEGINGMFKEGRGLFYAISLTVMGKMRDMNSDFGVLPYPKLEESDKDYISYVSAIHGNTVSVPVTASDPARTSAILEAMCCESGNLLMPAYYDVTVTNKTMRDEKSAEMLEYIFSHRTFDSAMIYNWGGLHSMLQQIDSADTFASSVQAATKKAEYDIRKNYEKLN